MSSSPHTSGPTPPALIARKPAQAFGTRNGAALVVLLAALAACASTAGRTGSSGVIDTRATAAVASEQASGAQASSAIGIPPFVMLANAGNISALGFALADLLTTDLSQSSQITLVERSRLSEVVRELDLVKSGRVDSASAPRVGKLMRASQLVLGSIDTMNAGQIRLSLRVANVETGMLDGAVDARAPMVDVLAAEKALAFRLIEALGVTLSPAERARIETYPTTSVEALNAFGRGVQANMLGDRRRAVDEFERALIADPGFQMARDRAQGVRVESRQHSEAPSVLPGMREINSPMNGTVDRVNRPIDILTSLSRPLGGPGDPSFPGSIVTVILTVSRP